MRKVSIIVTLALALGLILSACSGGNQGGTAAVTEGAGGALPGTGGTASPGAGGGLSTASPSTGGRLSTASPAAGGEGGTASPAAGAENGTPSPAEAGVSGIPLNDTVTPIAPSTTTEVGENGQPAGTPGAGGLPNTGAGELSKVSNLMQAVVSNADNQALGQVRDLVIDMGNQRIQFVLVNLTGAAAGAGKNNSTGGTGATGTVTSTATVSGTTGTGAGNAGTTSNGSFTAIPWGAFDASQQGNSGATPTLMLRSTFDEAILQQAPVVDPANLKNILGQSGWDSEWNSFWSGQGVDMGGSTGGSTSGTGADTGATGTVTATTGMTGTTGTVATGSLKGWALASDLLGQTLATTGSSSGSAGSIQDMIVDLNTGSIQWVILSGGAAQPGSLIPVPLGAFDISTAGDPLSFRSGIDSAFLSAAPTLDQSQFNSLSSGWDSDMQNYWQAYSGGTSSSGGTGTGTGGTATAVP